MNSIPGRKVNLLSFSTAARRLLLVLCCAALGLMQLGCATPPEGEAVHGKDLMLSFLATRDGRGIVIAGEKYHYVFSGDPAVASLLRWEGRTRITPSFIGEFKVAHNQGVEGQFRLMAFEADLTPEDQAFLIQTGFARTQVNYGDRTGPALRYSGTVRGTRYAAKPLKAADTVDFSRAHYVEYVEQETVSGPFGPLQASPLSNAADGSLLLGGAPVLVVQGGVDTSCRARFMDICFFR